MSIIQKNRICLDENEATISKELIICTKPDCAFYSQFQETLEVFVMESFAGGNVFSLSFNNFPKLRLIYIGAYCINNYSHQFRNVIGDDKGEYAFEIQHCPQLESVMLRSSCCNNFSKFVLSDCEKLSTVEFGRLVLEYARSLEISCMCYLIDF